MRSTPRVFSVPTADRDTARNIRLPNDFVCRRPGHRIQPRYPPDPVRELLRLPRARRPQARSRSAARPAGRRERQARIRRRGDRRRQAGRKRTGAPDRIDRRRSADAAGRLEQASSPPSRSRLLKAWICRRRRVSGALVVSADSPAGQIAGRLSRRRAAPANPIDGFVLAELGRHGLVPSPPADADHACPAAGIRFDRPAADTRAGGSIGSRCQRCRLRAVGRRIAGLASLRRANGDVVARPGALRRQRGLSWRSGRQRISVSRVRDSGFQREQAVRPVHDRAVGRRPAAERHAGEQDRLGLQPAWE